ncbi:T9SS type A sorting domain-containing protein [Marinoscillum sp.]|uniref:T9SS type A sorting domain-containing protein n=1 Tax=Marinoscillum sp. TaxID=2024838 RepID=UPI003BAA4A5A
MINRLNLPAFIAALLLFSQINAQVLDESFPNIQVKGRSVLRSFAELADGKLLISGIHPTNPEKSLIYRITPDGEIDESFKTDLQGQFYVKNNGNIIVARFGQIDELDPSGSIIQTKYLEGYIGGVGVLSNDEIVVVSGTNLIKYDQDLNIDESFNVETTGRISNLLCQDNIVYISGYFDAVNNVTVPGFAKILSTGEVSASFNPEIDKSTEVLDMEIQSDGKIICIIKNDPHIIRLNENGAIDETYSFNDSDKYFGSNKLELQNNKALVHLYSFEDPHYHYLVRLNENGTIDETFSMIKTIPSSNLPYYYTTSDGSIYTSIELDQDHNYYGITKIHNGEVTLSFKPEFYDKGYLYEVHNKDNTIYLVGEFNQINDIKVKNGAILDLQGNVLDFNVKENKHSRMNMYKWGSNSYLIFDYERNLNVVNESGEKLFSIETPGFSIPFYSLDSYCILSNDLRLISFNQKLFAYNIDGTIDHNFLKNTITGVSVFKELPSGEILLGGWDIKIDDVSQGPLLKLKSNGELDDSFKNGFEEFYGSIHRININQFGEIAITGDFTHYEDIELSKVVIIDSDGNFINTFENDMYRLYSLEGCRNGFMYSDGSSGYSFRNSNGDIVGDFEMIPDLYLEQLWGISFDSSNPNSVYLAGDFTIGDIKHQLIKLEFEDKYPTITNLDIESNVEDEPISISLDNATIIDEDSDPSELKLTVLENANYTYQDSQIIPAENYNGPLMIKLRVDDESHEGYVYEFPVEVTPVNDPPTNLTSNTEFAGTQGQVIEMTLTDFTAEDVDNVYPDDFTLKILENEHYELVSPGITTSIDFNGEISVPVTVNDGEFNSDTIQLTIPIAVIASTPKLQSIQLFPNPATDFISFKNSPADLSIIIRDLNGKELLSESASQDNHRMEIRNVPNGIYLIELNTGGSQYQQKIIINH